METNNIQIVHVICVLLYQRLVPSIDLLKNRPDNEFIMFTAFVNSRLRLKD